MVSTGVEDHVVSKVFSMVVALPHGGTTPAIQDSLGIKH